MPRRILFTSQKGGVGKSTLARSAAVSLAYLGRKVLLADFDVQQRTCMRWQAQRQARALKPVIEVAAFSKEKKLERVAFDYDDIVIDTHGQHDELSLDLAISSDVVFLPSSFSLDDVSPTLHVVELLRNAGVSSRRIAIVFCRTGELQATGAAGALDSRDESYRCARRNPAAKRRLHFAVRHRPDRAGSLATKSAFCRHGDGPGAPGIHRRGRARGSAAGSSLAQPG